MSKKVLDKAYSAIAAQQGNTKQLVGERRAAQIVQKAGWVILTEVTR